MMSQRLQTDATEDNPTLLKCLLKHLRLLIADHFSLRDET